jgi:hypothetical protein
MLGMLACDLQDLDIITSLVCLCVPTILGACVLEFVSGLEKFGGNMSMSRDISSEQWSVCKVSDSSQGKADSWPGQRSNHQHEKGVALQQRAVPFD